jgi:hypothetical protein
MLLEAKLLSSEEKRAALEYASAFAKPYALRAVSTHGCGYPSRMGRYGRR